MNKDEAKELFEGPLSELNEFANEIEKIKQLINLIIENFDLLKDDVTDEEVAGISSDVNVKLSKILAILKDILSDSKKLQSFINEIKLLKRKREKKLGREKSTKSDSDAMEELFKQLFERQKRDDGNGKRTPYQPNPSPKIPPYIFPPKKGGGGNITF